MANRRRKQPSRNELGPFGLTSPCENCPFRTDIRPYLRPERVREIAVALVRGSFFCHKTVTHTDDEGDDGEVVYAQTGREVHCAGALILLEKQVPDRSSQMMRIAERLGLYDRRKLKMDAPVYDSFEAMAKACKNPAAWKLLRSIPDET